MKVSEIYNLNKSQYELDFIDIDINKDTPLFLEPYILSKYEANWTEDANSYIKSFFSHFIMLLRNEDVTEARNLLTGLLIEPNETCLGLSRGTPHGKSLNVTDVNRIIDSVLSSDAITSGLVEDLEDFRVFIRNIGPDKLSDMTTNIIKRKLIEYTVDQCKLWGIDITPDIVTGIYWNREKCRWEESHAEMLVIDNRPIVLVPKNIVMFTDSYTPDVYKQHFLLNFLQLEHINEQSRLVKFRKDNTPYVTKKSIKEDFKDNNIKIDTEYLVDFTRKHRDVFTSFKQRTFSHAKLKDQSTLTDVKLDDVIVTLVSELQSTPSGKKDADKYHRIIAGILELLFFPHLSAPKVEFPIHDGRKRIDIKYDNTASQGFLLNIWKSYGIPCTYVMVECKNYSNDVGNPEVDQLSSRFNINRGKLGLLLCRTIENKNLLIKRCQDTFKDGRGLIIPLDDSDIIRMLNNFSDLNYTICNQVLMDKYKQINT